MKKQPITAALLACVLIASAQQPSRPAAAPANAAQTQKGPQVLVPNSGLKISVDTQLVVETVFVKDKSGKAVPGLKKEDFSVTEDGKAQDISFFDYEELSETPNPTLAPPAAHTATGDSKITAGAPTTPPPVTQPAAAAEPEVKPLTSNQIAPEKPGDLRYKDRRLMVMFFDMTSMPIPDQVRAQTAAKSSSRRR